MKALLCQPYLKKRADCLQRTLKKLLSLREHLQNKIIMTAAEQMATREVEQDFPFMDTDRVEVRYSTTGRGTGGITEVKMRNKTKWYPLLTKTRGDDEKTFNTKLIFQKKSNQLLTLIEGFR